MSLLDRLRTDVSGTTARSTLATPTEGAAVAALTGVWTAALSWLAITLPALLAWATSTQASASWSQAIRVSTEVWLVVHRVQLDVPGGAIALAPLAGTAIPAWLCWLAGRRIVASPTAVAALAVGYTAPLVFAAVLARGGGVQPVVWQAILAGLLLAGLAGGAGSLTGQGRSLTAVLAESLHLPGRVRRAAPAAAVAAVGVSACGALVMLASLVVHADRMLSLHSALHPGIVGGFVLVLAQLTVLPNLAIWGVAFVAGPGFALGVGTSVTPGGSDLALLPLVPVLGAVPGPGALPAALWLVVLAPVLVGALAGWWVARGSADEPGGQRSQRTVVLDALTAAALAATLLTVLLALSGGAAGPGVLDAVGPSAWKVGLALAVELAAGAAAAAWITHRRHR